MPSPGAAGGCGCSPANTVSCTPASCWSAYRRPLTVDRAYRLRESVAAELQLDWVFDGVPAEVLVVASPLWMVALGGLLALPQRPRTHWFTESERDWPQVCAVLDGWGW